LLANPLPEWLMAFRIEYSADAEKHLHQLMARQQATVLDQIVINLAHQPTVETRNRKRMRPNPLTPWELRVGDLRVYYDVKEEPEPVVYIIAVGVKSRNRVWIGNKEVRL
jgi:mRNA-degrading endonuclease RelE of RelBE toxin-antitoxin system